MHSNSYFKPSDSVLHLLSLQHAFFYPLFMSRINGGQKRSRSALKNWTEKNEQKSIEGPEQTLTMVVP